MNITARLRTAQPKSDSGDREDQERYREHQNFRARFSWTCPAIECREIPMHFRGRGITLLGVVRARFDEHVVELQQTLAVRSRAQLRIDLREIEPIFSSTSFAKKFAQAVNVGAWRARPFRR